jgi:ADP-dependent NAD(P)H-hydrate dehydratase
VKIKSLHLKSLRKLLPKRVSSQNKTHGGKTLIIAGSKNFFGAGILAATAAARVGSGYTTLMTDLKNFPICKHPDFLTLKLNSKFNLWSNYTSIAVGPGLGVNAQTEKIIRSLLKANIQNVVLDADAITVIAKKNIFPLISSWILTPHAGELARLLKMKSSDIELNRKKTLQMAQKKYQCHILLKGSRTLIQNSKMRVQIKTGNKALAKAGTGDVLTGMIAGFRAQGLSVFEAATLAATLHGQTADNWVKSGRDYLSMQASDVLDLIPIVIFNLRKKST